MTAVNYLWNPLNDNIVREFDDGGAVVAEYTTEPEEFGNVITQRRDVEDDYFHFDGVGSTLAVTNQAATVTDSRAYTAFGETTEQSGTTVFPVQFVGRNGYYRELEIEYYNVRRRKYYPEWSRWLSADPAPMLRQLHIYTYIHNSPLGDIDASGLGSATLNYFCIGVNAICHGSCTCTEPTSAGWFLAAAMIPPLAPCCEQSCIICTTLAPPVVQPTSMFACMQVAVRTFFGPLLACACT